MRSAAITVFVFFVVLIGTTVPSPMFPLYESRYGVGPLFITVIFGIYAIGVVGGLLAFGHLSDQIGRRPVMAAALVLSGVAASLFLITVHPAMLLGARVISGISAALITGTANAALNEQLPPARKRWAPVLSVFANMGGLACGALIAGILVQEAANPLRLAWIVDLVLVVASLLALPLVAETAPQPREAFHFQRPGLPAEVRGTFAQVSAPAAVGFGMLGVLTSITGVLLVSELDRHEPALTGAVLFLAFVSVIAGQLVDRRLPAGLSLFAAGLALILSGCLIAVAVLTASLRALVAAAVLTGLGTGGGFGAGLRTIGARVPAEQRGAAFSAFFVVLYSALALPALGVGFVTELAGLRWAGTVFAVLLALVTFAAMVSLRRRRLSDPD